MLSKNIMPEGYLEAPLAYDAVWAMAVGKYLYIYIYIFCKYNTFLFLSRAVSPYFRIPVFLYPALYVAVSLL